MLRSVFQSAIVNQSSAFLNEAPRRLRHAPDREAASRAPGRRAQQLGRAAGPVRLLLLRRRLARADERLRRHRRRSSRARYDNVGGLDRRRPRSGDAARSSSSRSCRSTPSCYLLLSMVVPIPWLERVPTYKEQMEQLSDKDLSTLGFLGYPLLQTADVIIYDAHFVPVGEDQVRAPRAGARSRPPLPQFLRRAVRRAAAAADARFRGCPDSTTARCSKSYGNTIDLSDDAGDGAQEGDADVHGSRSASAPTSPAPSKATRCSCTTTRSTRTPPRSTT